MLAIRLPDDLEARLEALAKRTGRTKTFHAREAIIESIDDLEDLYLAPGALCPDREGHVADLVAQRGGAPAWPGRLSSPPPPQ